MKYLIIPVLLGLGLAGCSQSKSEETITEIQQSPSVQPTPKIISAPENQSPATVAVPGNQTGQPEVVATAQAQPGHSVAYQAELNMAVEDFDKVTDRINTLLESHGAYLGTAHESRTNGQRRQEMTLKVPPAHFVALVSDLGKLGRIENKDISSADITADVLATAANLDNQHAAEAQLAQQLARATSATERANLASQARRQRADAAATEAQLQQFGARAAWATLTLRYYQVLPANELITPEPPAAPRFYKAFGWGWALVLQLAVGLAYAWPVLLLAALGTWSLHRWRLRQSRLV